MTNALYQAAIRELEQVLPPRVVSRTLKDGLRQQNQSPDSVELDHFDAILKGPVYRQLQVSMAPDQAKSAVSEILERLRRFVHGPADDASAAEESEPDEVDVRRSPDAALQGQEDELVALNAALKPFNLYFEWPEVQKLRAQVQLLEEEHRQERNARALVEEAHRQLAAVRQKLEDHLVIQARELAELEEALEQVQPIGGVKVRRLENLIGHVREAQESRQLATAEVERARKIAKDLRKLVESSVYSEGAEAGEAAEGAAPDPATLSPELSQRLEQLDREAEQHEIERLSEDFAHLLDHLPELANRRDELREALGSGRRVDAELASLRDTLAAAADRHRMALREELAQIEAQAQELPAAVDASELLQAVAVARGVLETTLPSLEDTQYIRRLHRLVLGKRDEHLRFEAEAEAQREAGLAEQRALLERESATLQRYASTAGDREALDALEEAVRALDEATSAGRLAPELAAAVRRAEERLEHDVAAHADDPRMRERAQLRALSTKVEALPQLDVLTARAAGVQRELQHLLDAAMEGPVDPVQLEAVRSLVEALRRDAIDTCRTRLEQLAERASEIDAERLLGRIQSANNVLDDDVYPDVHELEAALRQERDAFREARFGELRRLEREASEYVDTSVEEAQALADHLARAREQLESGGVAFDLDRGWDLLESVRATVEQRLADFEPRLDAALLAFEDVAMLNSEDVASARRILKHLDSQRDAFPRVSIGLRIQLEQALESAETLLAKLQEEVEATRAIADQLMSGNVLDDVLGLFGPGATPREDGRPDARATDGGTTWASWLASLTDEPGIRSGAILGTAGWEEGGFPAEAEEALRKLDPLDRTLARLGQELGHGPVRIATLELDVGVLVVAWLGEGRRLVLHLETPTVLSLVGHRLRAELDDVQRRTRGAPNA